MTLAEITAEELYENLEALEEVLHDKRLSMLDGEDHEAIRKELLNEVIEALRVRME